MRVKTTAIDTTIIENSVRAWERETPGYTIGAIEVEGGCDYDEIDDDGYDGVSLYNQLFR